MAGTNTYGFDFLRAEHNLSSSSSINTKHDVSYRRWSSSDAHNNYGGMAEEEEDNNNNDGIPDVSHKSILEQQADVLLFLKQHRSSGCLPPSVIYKALGIDVTTGSDNNQDNNIITNTTTTTTTTSPSTSLVNMLLANPKIKVEEIPDPENPSLTMYQFGYRAKFSTVQDKTSLLAQINRMKNGIKTSELLDAYDGVEKDIDTLINCGDVLGVFNTEDRDKILFPRGDSFLVELDGCITLFEEDEEDEALPPPPPPPPTTSTAIAASTSVLVVSTTTVMSGTSSVVPETAAAVVESNTIISDTAAAMAETTAGTTATTIDTSTTTTAIIDTPDERERTTNASAEIPPASGAVHPLPEYSIPKSENTSDDVTNPLASSNIHNNSNQNSSNSMTTLQKRRTTSYRYIHTDIDPQPQIRRGEAIRIGGEWYRVSSQVIPNVPLSKQPPRAQAPLSVVSLKDLSKKNEIEGYCYKFTRTRIPLDGILSEGGMGRENLRKAKVARERLFAMTCSTYTVSTSEKNIGNKEGGNKDSDRSSIRLVGLGRSALGGGGGGAAASASTLISSFASEKSPSIAAEAFAKSVAVRLGTGGGGSISNSIGGSRKLPASNKSSVSSMGLANRASRGGVGTITSRPLDAESVKAAVEQAMRAASDPSLSYTHAVRHGCTKDVREMYFSTLSLVPTSESDLHKALLEHKLIEPNEKLKRPPMKRKNNVDNDGKPQKRRYYERKNMRRTNTHLDGTEIGAMLARAAEKQARGKSVGDGGM